MNVADHITLVITSMAHGGEAIGRHDGQVVFVRGAIPGEEVIAEVTEAPEHRRFLRARTVEVLTPSPARVSPPCQYATRCGGCDWQYIAVDAQRRLKAQVIAEQLARIGKEPSGRWTDLSVEALPGDSTGLHWRTRMRYAVDAEGRAGLRAHHSHDVVPIQECLIAEPGIGGAAVLGRDWTGVTEVLAAQRAGTARATAPAAAAQGRVEPRLGALP